MAEKMQRKNSQPWCEITASFLLRHFLRIYSAWRKRNPARKDLEGGGQKPVSSE
jgi:hypothetical protein